MKKITKAKLKQIIKEELEVVLTNEEVEEMFGEDVRAQVEESEQARDQRKMDAAQDVARQEISFEKWIAVVFQKGAQIDDNSPNPYDAWMSGQSPEEYASMQEGLFGGKFGNKQEIPAKNKPRERTDAEKDKLDRFYQAVNKKMEEKKLSKPEKKEKERVVKGMKKSKKDFKQRYGGDAESVMYATATKIAKEKK
tara:strand:+ start:1153 stop:1737 length:585 start_codon:yes stop_codon:yes gene_type:complete